MSRNSCVRNDKMSGLIELSKLFSVFQIESENIHDPDRTLDLTKRNNSNDQRCQMMTTTAYRVFGAITTRQLEVHNAVDDDDDDDDLLCPVQQR